MTPRTESNPLLDVSGPTRYGSIDAAHGEPAVRQRVQEAEALVDVVMATPGASTWSAIVDPIDEAEERIERAWTAIENLEATLGTPELRAAHRAGQEIMTRHRSKFGQDARFFRALQALATGPSSDGLSAVHRKILADQIRDFRLAGVDLNDEGKERSRAIRSELASLGSKFAENAADDAKDFRLVLDRAEDVEGLPATLLATARAAALADDPAAPAGRYSFKLDQSVLGPFMMFQRNRELRERFHRAWVGRASSGARDNGPVIVSILKLRRELAQLLGFADYAELSLAKKMARSPAEVRAFLLDLADRALPRAREETAEVAALARKDAGIEPIGRHDIGFYRETIRAALHGFSQEELRAYFPLPRVLSGLSDLLLRLYGVEMKDRTADGVVPVWHEDVRVLEISDRGTVLGHVLFDPYVRTGKRAGAWVSGCVSRKLRSDGTIQRPVAHLVCNLPAPTPATDGTTGPALISHDDVRTLFHEFGHALHHVLSTADRREVSGIHGVPWDGVEFPSQFHENWIWQPESLALVSSHVETGESLPAALLDKMRGARTFFAASDLLRQVELALIDLELHTTFDPARDDVRDVIDSVRRRVAVVPAPDYDRFENSFLHIFQGGYAAGYYGYKWAEVLAADAFGRFEEEGIFSQRAAQDFRNSVLACGGGEDFLELFVRFRGRAPDSAALLRQAGIA